MRLKNNKVEVKINSFGAEITSIIKNNIEYIWQADPKYWKRSSPVLFPIVGKLKDNEYIFENKTYNMSQHGFARDNEFTLVNYNDNNVLYLLKENEETLKHYPFKFNLYIEYELMNNELIVSWIVENTNNFDMYFQIGAHPAFNFSNGSILDINKVTNQYQLNGTPYISNKLDNIKINAIVINDNTFLDDALIFENINKIKLKDEDKSVIINSKGFPYFGIWSNVIDGKNSPFVCLEPWHGISDFIEHDKNLINKVGINVLKRNETFKTSYSIIID